MNTPMGSKINEILIVDDTPANLRLLSETLLSAGYRPRAAASGAHALESVRLSPPDLILLDIKMPEMNGFEVCEQLKTNERTRDIPVIFISALDEIEDKLRGFRAGGVDYITKPFQTEEVLARVETHFKLRLLQRQLQESNARMHRELHLAGHMQANFMPQVLPVPPGWQMSAALQPAAETSGDFYDVFPLPGGRVGLLVADVVDKGVAAALFMVLSWSLVRGHVEDDLEHPGAVMDIANQKILEIIDNSQFVTLFYGVLNPVNGELVYANAGHNPPLLLRGAKITGSEKLIRTGIPLGLYADQTWEQTRVTLNPGDLLVMYSDGITEAVSPSGEAFGEQRLIASLQRHAAEPAARMQQALLDDLHAFMDDDRPQDDITLLVVRREEAPLWGAATR